MTELVKWPSIYYSLFITVDSHHPLLIAMCLHRASPSTIDTEAEILGRKWDKSLVSFPPCYSQSPLQTDLTQIFGTELGVYNVNLQYYCVICHFPIPLLSR
jgi:hypothetical protein